MTAATASATRPAVETATSQKRNTAERPCGVIVLGYWGDTNNAPLQQITSSQALSTQDEAITSYVCLCPLPCGAERARQRGKCREDVGEPRGAVLEVRHAGRPPSAWRRHGRHRGEHPS